LRNLKSFAEKGWRILLFAYKLVDKETYEKYDQMIANANNDILNREANMAKINDEIESELTLVGATIVEDKLQEDVEATLIALREAGIKIWVLTGDKLESAVNICDSCKLFSEEMKKLTIHGHIDDMRLRSLLNEYNMK
jgi:magnesium-transporting ATPase (P-type)